MGPTYQPRSANSKEQMIARKELQALTIEVAQEIWNGESGRIWSLSNLLSLNLELIFLFKEKTRRYYSSNEHSDLKGIFQMCESQICIKMDRMQRKEDGNCNEIMASSFVPPWQWPRPNQGIGLWHQRSRIGSSWNIQTQIRSKCGRKSWLCSGTSYWNYWSFGRVFGRSCREQRQDGQEFSGIEHTAGEGSYGIEYEAGEGSSGSQPYIAS